MSGLKFFFNLASRTFLNLFFIFKLEKQCFLEIYCVFFTRKIQKHKIKTLQNGKKRLNKFQTLQTTITVACSIWSLFNRLLC